MPQLGTMEIITIIGLVLTIIALILSIIFFMAGRKKMMLEYDISSTPLVTDEMTSIPDLEVFYCHQPVKNLTSTTIRFFNWGNQMLDKHSFAEKQPLCLTTDGHFFRGQSTVNATASNPNSIPSLSEIDDQTRQVVFEFLEPKQSFQLTLLHDGELSVSGCIKNGKLKVLDHSPGWADYITFAYFLIVSIASLIALITDALLNKNYAYLLFLFMAVCSIVADVFVFSDIRECIRLSKKKKP